VGQRENHVVVVTGQEPGPLEGQPALSLEVGTLRTRPVSTGVVPDPGDVAVGTGLDMASEGRRPALHDGARSSTDVGGQGMRLGIRGKGVLEDRLQGHEGHQCLRTRAMGPSSGWFFTVSRELSPLQAVSPTWFYRKWREAAILAPITWFFLYSMEPIYSRVDRKNRGGWFREDGLSEPRKDRVGIEEAGCTKVLLQPPNATRHGSERCKIVGFETIYL